jgi:malate dehydrogenase (oxaloacetate-decarboxylating)(NADP+)
MLATMSSPYCTAAAPPLAHGLAPTMLDPSNHLQRSLLQLRSKDKPIEKYIFLSQLKQTDEQTFFKLLLEHMPVHLLVRFSLLRSA